jgi:rubrerythrin
MGKIAPCRGIGEAVRTILAGAGDGFDALTQGKDKDMRALRISIMAEYEATNLYERMAEQVKDPKVKELLLDVAREEKVHIGEFEEMLNKLDPEHKPSLKEGADEVNAK